VIRQTSIVHDLEQVTLEQSAVYQDYKDALVEEVLADQKYRTKLSQAGLSATGTVFEKENKAFLESADDRLYAKLAEANTKALSMHLSILKNNVEAARTMSYAIDSDHKNSGMRV